MNAYHQPHTDTLLRDIYQGITTVSTEGVSYALVIAFFLANLPEVRPIVIVKGLMSTMCTDCSSLQALSSSIIMLENGMSKLVISGMWLFLVGMSQPSDVTVHNSVCLRSNTMSQQ
jgi:hypothetical protein